MKTEIYIVEIEMPDGDSASPSWVKDVLQSESDIEDEGRWKVSVKAHWKPSDEQLGIIAQSMAVLKVVGYNELGDRLGDISEQLHKLREE